MLEKEKKTADELSQMVQGSIDPRQEWVRIKVGPKPAPNASWIVIASGSTERTDLLHAAERKAMELSNIYEMIGEE